MASLQNVESSADKMPPLQSVESQVQPLPNLGFSVRVHRYWFLVWLLILCLENCVIPLILYYALRAHVKLFIGSSHPLLSIPHLEQLTSPPVCTIITGVWGFILYIEYFVRFWKFRHAWSTSQPLISSRTAISEIQSHRNRFALSEAPAEGNSISRLPNTVSAPSRWYCDASHWLFSVTLAITLLELVIATVPKNPYIKLLAMVNPSMLLSVFVVTFLLDIAYFMHMRAPFRISSVAKGEFIRPGLYTLLEDVIAVDFGQGYVFRTDFNERWEASPIFRRLLFRLSILWSLPGLLVPGICIVTIFTTDIEIGFAVGWGLPYLWIVLWIALTMIVVGRGLNEEKQEWLARN